MESTNKFFNKFLLSKNSNLVSHAISKLHNTYSTKYNLEKINFLKILDLILSYLDSGNVVLKKRDSVKILIISNIVSIDNLKKDLYFGNLDKSLNKKKIKTIKAFRNFTYKKSSELSKIMKNDNIIFSKRLNYLAELKFACLIFKEILVFIFLNKYRYIKKYIKLRDLFSIASNLRLVSQIEEVIKVIKPKIIIFTYEGHAWERLLVNLCKTKYKSINTIGYQFSTIKSNQIGFFRKLQKNYNPDYIATTGQKTFDLIKKKINFAKIFKLGSTNFIKRKNKKIKENDLLVALDGEPNELFKMVDFCIDFSRKNIEFNIIIRLHPILKNNSKIVSKILLKIKRFKNISISGESLEKDLQITRYLLFTDTAICITCLSYNVIPIFFVNKFSKNIFDDNFPKKNIIKNIIDLKNILKIKNNNALTHYFKNYRDKYFEKFNHDELRKILKIKQ